jgi:hypothetical protein
MQNLRSRAPSRRYRRAWYGYCLFRICWETLQPNSGSFVGDGNAYSNKLSVGLSPHWFKWDKVSWSHDFELYVLGLRIHYARSYGGRFG